MMSRLSEFVPLYLPGEVRRCPACGSPSRVIDYVTNSKRRIVRHLVLLVSGCEGCGLAFVNPPMPQEALHEYYAGNDGWKRETSLDVFEADAKKYVQNSKKYRNCSMIWRHVKDHVRVTAGSALDFGCGTGTFLDVLQDQGWATTGIEPGVQMAAQRHRMIDAVPAEPTFDLVIAHHVFEHLTDPLAQLRQLAAALNDDGVLFLSTPSVDSLPRHRSYRYCFSAHHVSGFTEACMRSLFARAGLQFVQTFRSDDLDKYTSKKRPLRFRCIGRKCEREVDGTDPSPLKSLLAAVHAYHEYEGDRHLRLRRHPLGVRLLARRRDLVMRQKAECRASRR